MNLCTQYAELAGFVFNILPTAEVGLVYFHHLCENMSERLSISLFRSSKRLELCDCSSLCLMKMSIAFSGEVWYNKEVRASTRLARENRNLIRR